MDPTTINNNASSIGTEPIEYDEDTCAYALVLTLTIPVSYLGLLHLFDWNGTDRNSTPSIIRRSIGVTLSSLLSVVLTANMLNSQNIDWRPAMGVRLSPFFTAIFLPTILTAILFFGPLAMQVVDESLFDVFRVSHWTELVQDPVVIRNLVIAPVSEEIAFRACAIPLMLRCYDSNTVMWWSPCLFSLSHYHHVGERLKHGSSLLSALALCSFQAAYTYVFGVYSAFMFIRTGHLMSCISCHVFCNYMGFPEVQQLFEQPSQTIRLCLIACFVLGVCLWCAALYPLTEPELYVI